jgi:streptomycin 6-kinase
VPDRPAWLERVPELLERLAAEWSLTVGEPFEREVSAAWVAPVRLADGTTAVLKLGLPHFEADHEIDGLRFWDGDPTVRVLAADRYANAMLLERCEPGTHLRGLAEPEQDVVVAGLLRRLWRPVREPHPFRPLADLTGYWRERRLPAAPPHPDPGLLDEALALYEELPRTATRAVLLATDLHAGNILRAEREPWLAIDPKPFVGDPAYDVTQHLLNCTRLRADPAALVARLADLAGVDAERVRLWTFARAAHESGEWEGLLPVAHALAP